MPSSFKVDYKELEQLQSKFEKMTLQFEVFLRKFLTEIAERLIASTKKKTPVVTGNLRSAWELGNIEGAGNTLSVEIKNGMEYATEVEYGHRLVDSNGNEIKWVNGRFMLSVSIEYISQQIPLRYAKSLKEYCDKLGIKAND